MTLSSVGDFFVIYYDSCEPYEPILIDEPIDPSILSFVSTHLFTTRKPLIFLVSTWLDFVLKSVSNKKLFRLLQ